MIDHLSIGTHDLAASIEFYRRTLEPLGYVLQHAAADEASFGPRQDRTFWLYPDDDVHPIARMHIAFAAPSEDAVAAAHDAACATGGKSVRAPGPRPDISESYFGAIVLDPDGYRLELVLAGVM